MLGNMSLERFDAADAPADAELAERMIRKLRAGLMPPPGTRRPTEEALTALAVSLEEQLDAAAAANPNPGRRTFQRLNRAEYRASIRDLLDLEIDPGAHLPLDTRSANFDNIADAQLLPATLTDGYLRAAAEISRLAVGDPHITPSESTYRVSRWDSQTERVEGRLTALGAAPPSGTTSRPMATTASASPSTTRPRAASSATVATRSIPVTASRNCWKFRSTGNRWRSSRSTAGCTRRIRTG